MVTGQNLDETPTREKEKDDGATRKPEDELSWDKTAAPTLCYGTREFQASEGGEADLHKHMLRCTKNPGHTQFIPVREFTGNHLPDGYRDDDIVEFVKRVAELTVRVCVTKTSTERPEFWPESKEPYSFYDQRGSDVFRTGTGMVCGVCKFTDDGIRMKGNEPRRSQKNRKSDTPGDVRGEIKVCTATHVVFDDVEAEHTTCRLFFDQPNSPLVTLDGWTVEEACVQEDRCVLKCFTRDVDLLDKLSQIFSHWWDLWYDVNRRYKSSAGKDRLTFIVSHPHGCPKQLSVGRLIARETLNGDGWKTSYKYTTSTCPGSSGAYVYALGHYYDGWLNGRHVHTGVNSEGRNYSGAGLDWPLQF